MITARIDIGPLLANLSKAAALTQRDTAEMIKQQATLFIWNSGNVPGVINITPPFNHKAKTGNQAFAQGQGALKRDLRVPFSPQKGSTMANARTQSERGVQADSVLLFARKDGSLFGVERSYFQPSPSYSGLRNQHKRYFTGGKMTKAGSFTRDIGRWRFIDKWVISQADFDVYAANAGQRIGFAAAAWYQAAVEAGLTPRGVPAWVRKHSSAPGSASIHTSPTAFAIELSSSLGYNSGLNMSRLATIALDYRARAIDRQLPHLIRSALRKAGLAD